MNIGSPGAAAHIYAAIAVVAHGETGGRIDRIAGHACSPFERLNAPPTIGEAEKLAFSRHEDGDDRLAGIAGADVGVDDIAENRCQGVVLLFHGVASFN